MNIIKIAVRAVLWKFGLVTCKQHEAELGRAMRNVENSVRERMREQIDKREQRLASMIEQALKLRFDDAGAKCFVGAEFDRRMLALSFLDHNRIDTTAMQLIARTVGKEIERQVYELIMHRGHRDHRDTENTR